MTDSGDWRGCSTVPELFRASVNDWGNNSYLGVRHQQRDGKLDPWLEWETYREVELSVTALARSMRVVLGADAAPGMTVTILGPPSIEAVKIWQACMHLAAVPLLVPCDGSLRPAQLAQLLSAFKVTAVFAHQEQQHLLLGAIQAMQPGSEASTLFGALRESTTPTAPKLVVVWGAGGIRYTEPDAEITQLLSAAGVACVKGYEAFKRSHFNDEPAAAFADMLLPQSTDVAAVVVTVPTAAAAAAAAAAAGSNKAERQVVSNGLHWQAESLSHAMLVAAAAAMLRQRFPRLESTLQPYVAGETECNEWAGRPHVVTSCITGSSLTSTDKLIKLVAATAAAGRVSFDPVDEDTIADGMTMLADL